METSFENLVDLGKRLNLPAPFIGTLLTQLKLRTPSTKKATKLAVKQGFGRNERDERSEWVKEYTVWNTEKVGELVNKCLTQLKK